MQSGHDFLPDERRKTPAIIVIASKQDALRFAADVFDVDPRLDSDVSMIHPAELVYQVDYQREFVIFVSQGAGRAAPSRAMIQTITRDNDQVVVNTEFGDLASEATTEHFDIVAISKSGSWNRVIQFDLVVDDDVLAQTTHFVP